MYYAQYEMNKNSNSLYIEWLQFPTCSSQNLLNCPLLFQPMKETASDPDVKLAAVLQALQKRHANVIESHIMCATRGSFRPGPTTGAEVVEFAKAYFRAGVFHGLQFNLELYHEKLVVLQPGLSCLKREKRKKNLFCCQGCLCLTTSQNQVSCSDFFTQKYLILEQWIQEAWSFY